MSGMRVLGSLILIDQVFPLPVEGAETKVLADDQEVANYMINLGDLLETVSSIAQYHFILPMFPCDNSS